jgi:hypothetical protein
MPIRVLSNGIRIVSLAVMVEHAVLDGLRELPGDWAVSIDWPAGGDQYAVDVDCPDGSHRKFEFSSSAGIAPSFIRSTINAAFAKKQNN